MTQRKAVPKEIKNEILAKVKDGEKVADLARQYGISDKSIYTSIPGCTKTLRNRRYPLSNITD